MEEKVIINSSCHEIPNVKSVYWIWHDNFISIEKVRREELWRINKLNLETSIVPKLFNIDVTEWQWDEVGSRVGNGGVLTKQLKGFVPKLNEWAESYFNEMFRRPITVFIEDFEDVVYLFGGEKCRATFSFNKSISGRNGYDIIITTLSDESSLIINDTDYFPAPPDSGLICDPVTINLDGTDILTAAAGSIVTINLEDTDEVQVIPNNIIVVGNNVKLVFDAPEAPPAGVLFDFAYLQQRTSYGTGDEGERNQGGWNTYAHPDHPKVIAQLDTTLGANMYYRLKDNLVVGGVSNKLRYVDVDGGQTFSATGNKNLVAIDKLTGIMFTRTDFLGANINWSNLLSGALAHSIVVNGITYDDWVLVSLPEMLKLFNSSFKSNQTDPISGAAIVALSANLYHTATTSEMDTTRSQQCSLTTTGREVYTYLKTSNSRPLYIRKCQNLITAP